MAPDPQELLASLDELLAQTPVEHLPALLNALHVRAGVALTRMEASTWAGGNGPEQPAQDENLPVKEASRRLGVSAAWMYRHSSKLPFTVRIGRRVLFSSSGMEKWNHRRRGR